MICPKCSEDISITAEYAALIEKMNKAKDFLEQHPALGGGSVFSIHDNLWYSAQKVCKRGFCELRDGEIDVRYSPENYKRYKELFDIELKEEPEIKEFCRITVPYKDHFGEPWKFDHVEYWGEMSFVMFQGMDYSKYFDPLKWGRYAGIETSGRSFEELIINAAKAFKRTYGNFSEEDFLTEKEKENHAKEWPFFFVPCKDNPKLSRMEDNKKYFRVTDAEINRRWVKWFAKTPYAQKNWKEACKEILAGKSDSNK